MELSLNTDFLIFYCPLKIKAVCIGIVDLILLMLLFSDPLFLLEFSGYQCQDGIKYPLQHFSFLGDTQMLLYILQGVKASMYANCGLKLRKTRSEAFKLLKELFLWSIKTMIGS
jgi:hypothetical protein